MSAKVPAPSLPWAVGRAILFRLDAELAHELALGSLACTSGSPVFTGLLEAACARSEPALATEVLGIQLANPLGVAAGFDKDARAVRGLAALGFGFVEVGTVTPRPQPGNPRPRLFRLPADGAIVNRLGFPSEGARALAARLTELEQDGGPPRVVGVNLGKNRQTANRDAVGDYLSALRTLDGLGDYLAVNVSSPNTPGLRDLQDGERLGPLVGRLVEAERELAAARGASRRPLLVKLSPDLSDDALAAALDATAEAGADGFIATNTTTRRPDTLRERGSARESGGLSGAPLLEGTLRTVARAFRRFEGRLPVIGVGGVSSGEDAWRLIRAGASLVQAYSGFVLGGPAFPRNVLGALAECLAASGLRSVSEAVGADT